MLRQIVRADHCTYISQYYAHKNFLYPARDSIFIGRYQGPGDSYRSLLQFDLGLFQSGRELIDFQQPQYLRLCIFRNETARGAAKAWIHRILNPWNASRLTWKQQPRVHPIPELEFLIPPGNMELMLLDISGLIKSWIKGRHPNYGLMLKGAEDSETLTAFYGLTETGPRTRPALLLHCRENRPPSLRSFW